MVFDGLFVTLNILSTQKGAAKILQEVEKIVAEEFRNRGMDAIASHIERNDKANRLFCYEEGITADEPLFYEALKAMAQRVVENYSTALSMNCIAKLKLPDTNMYHWYSIRYFESTMIIRTVVSDTLDGFCPKCGKKIGTIDEHMAGGYCRCKSCDQYFLSADVFQNSDGSKPIYGTEIYTYDGVALNRIKIG